MPLAYRCDPAAKLAISVFDGDVTHAEWTGMLARQLADPLWQATTMGLSDLSTALIPMFTDSQLEEIKQQYASRADRSAGRRMAMIANRSWDAALLLGDAAQRLTARAIVFNELTRACTWLGVDVAAVRTTIADLRAELKAGLQ